MPSRLYPALATVAACLFMQATALAQSSLPGLYCTSGLQPDGYIDFSSLPKSPNFSQTEEPPVSAPVTATLPVRGVAGLTVTVTIPALTQRAGLGPVYNVDGGSLTLNGLPAHGSQNITVLTLNFSQPVEGIGLNAVTSGRFAYTYTLMSGDAENPVFSTTANGFTYSEGPQTQSLQLVGLQSPIQSASVLFQGDEYTNLTLANLRIQSVPTVATPTAVPMKGLQQWLRADTILFPSDIWQDQSGNGHNATPVNGGAIRAADGRNCLATLQFAGLNSPTGATGYYTFNLPIAGWDQMTVFLVASATRLGPLGSPGGDDAVIYWTPEAHGASTFFSPFQTRAYALFGTAGAGGLLSYTRPGGGIGQDFTVTRAVHDHGVDSLYVGGVLAAQQPAINQTLGGTSGAGFIGYGANNTLFNGEISEILVYNLVLTEHEAATVEQYLARKFGTQ